jgi:hypothetical protein
MYAKHEATKIFSDEYQSILEAAAKATTKTVALQNNLQTTAQKTALYRD